MARWACPTKLLLEEVRYHQIITGDTCLEGQPTGLHFHLVSTRGCLTWDFKFPCRPRLQGQGWSALYFVLVLPLSLFFSHSFSLLFFQCFLHSLWSRAQVVPPTGLENVSLRLLTPPHPRQRREIGEGRPIYFCFSPWAVQMNAAFTVCVCIIFLLREKSCLQM